MYSTFVLLHWQLRRNQFRATVQLQQSVQPGLAAVVRNKL